MTKDLTVYQSQVSSILTPLTPKARDWMRTQVDPQTIWWSGGAVVENQYLKVILEAAQREGLTVDKEGE